MSTCLLCGGSRNSGRKSLHFEAIVPWRRIVIDGFGAEYGTTYKVAPEDSVQIYVQNYRRRRPPPARTPQQRFLSASRAAA